MLHDKRSNTPVTSDTRPRRTSVFCGYEPYWRIHVQSSQKHSVCLKSHREKDANAQSCRASRQNSKRKKRKDARARRCTPQRGNRNQSSRNESSRNHLRQLQSDCDCSGSDCSDCYRQRILICASSDCDCSDCDWSDQGCRTAREVVMWIHCTTVHGKLMSVSTVLSSALLIIAGVGQFRVAYYCWRWYPAC